MDTPTRNATLAACICPCRFTLPFFRGPIQVDCTPLSVLLFPCQLLFNNTTPSIAPTHVQVEQLLGDQLG